MLLSYVNVTDLTAHVDYSLRGTDQIQLVEETYRIMPHYRCRTVIIDAEYGARGVGRGVMEVT